MDLNKVNDKRRKKKMRDVLLNPLLLNINGRKFREDEINIKLSDIYPKIDCDLDWTHPEIFDPWKRAKKHMELFDESFGAGRVAQIRLDHFIEYTHICEIYKFFNRAYQMLKLGGILLCSFIDFSFLFKEVIETLENTELSDAEKIVKLETYEKCIFTESDASGMYYHRSILTESRVGFYLERSFFTDYVFEESYNEVIKSKIIEVRAIKDTEKQVVLAPDGTLQEVSQ